jgi:hypothetical protein
VISVYLPLDPGDRADGWRTALRNGLSALEEDGGDHAARAAMRATVKRIRQRFDGVDRRELARGEVGFVEVSANGGRERWWSTQVEPAGPCVVHADTPLVAPLLQIAERAVPRGVVLASADLVRLLEWRAGRLEELDSWELTIISGDWRERKAQRVRDPGRSAASSASGHDQFDERLDENRGRFLGECGRRTLAAAQERGWRQVVAIGPPKDTEPLREGFGASSVALELGSDADLISAPRPELQAAVTAAWERLDGERERSLVERAIGESGGGAPGATGPDEVGAALEQGQVQHLLLDAALPEERLEPLARRALGTGAEVSILDGIPAALLEPVGGIAATLRFSLP